MLLAAVLPDIVEELVLHGVIFRAIRVRVPLVFAVVISTGLDCLASAISTRI